MTSWWVRWRLKSPASRLFTQAFIQAQIKENIKALRHWPLCGEFTGAGEFPAQRASSVENVSIWWRHHNNCITIRYRWVWIRFLNTDKTPLIVGTLDTDTKCQLRGKCFHLMTSSCNRICLGYHRIALDIVHISHRLCRSWLMPSSTSDKARLKHIQHGTVIKRSIFSQILTIDTPYLAHKGEVWGVCCDSKILLTFCHCYRSAVCHIVINWTAL